MARRWYEPNKAEMSYWRLLQYYVWQCWNLYWLLFPLSVPATIAAIAFFILAAF